MLIQGAAVQVVPILCHTRAEMKIMDVLMRDCEHWEVGCDLCHNVQEIQAVVENLTCVSLVFVTPEADDTFQPCRD